MTNVLKCQPPHWAFWIVHRPLAHFAASIPVGFFFEERKSAFLLFPKAGFPPPAAHSYVYGGRILQQTHTTIFSLSQLRANMTIHFFSGLQNKVSSLKPSFLIAYPSLWPPCCDSCQGHGVTRLQKSLVSKLFLSQWDTFTVWIQYSVLSFGENILLPFHTCRFQWLLLKGFSANSCVQWCRHPGSCSAFVLHVEVQKRMLWIKVWERFCTRNTQNNRLVHLFHLHRKLRFLKAFWREKILKWVLCSFHASKILPIHLISSTYC